MQGKFRVNELILNSANGPQNVDYDLTGTEDFSISIDYATATVGNVELQASNDGINFVPVTDSDEPVVPGGDTGLWNVTDCHYLFIRVVIPAGITDCNVRLVGQRLEVKE